MTTLAVRSYDLRRFEIIRALLSTRLHRSVNKSEAMRLLLDGEAENERREAIRLSANDTTRNPDIVRLEEMSGSL
jgi:hypothetical protein